MVKNLAEINTDDLLVRRLLVDTELSDGSKLFTSGADLGKQIANLPNTRFTKVESASAFITQVFGNRRKCSDELRKAILEAVRIRLRDEDPEVVEHWVERINHAIDLQNSKKGRTKSLQTEDLFDELLLMAENAGEQFIVTAKTAEEDARVSKAGSLREILIRRLNLYQSDEVGSTRLTQPNTRYIFYLPTEETAVGFWKGLFEWIVFSNPLGQGLPPNTASSKLKDVDDSDYLQVYKVPKFVCGSAIVVFDPGKSESAAFSFCYHSDDRVSVLKWDSESVYLWKLCVYRAHNLPKERIRWAKVEELIDMKDAQYRFERKN